jgi:hypothetical protein
MMTIVMTIVTTTVTRIVMTMTTQMTTQMGTIPFPKHKQFMGASEAIMNSQKLLLHQE